MTLPLALALALAVLVLRLLLANALAHANCVERRAHDVIDLLCFLPETPIFQLLHRPLWVVQPPASVCLISIYELAVVSAAGKLNCVSWFAAERFADRFAREAIL